MFELLCVISMALCKVLVLVNMGIFYFFFFFFIHNQAIHGALSGHVSRQIFLVLYRLCPRTKSQEALPVCGGLLSEVFLTRELKRYFNRRSTKQQWQVHPGDTFQPQGLTPAPLTRRTGSISLPGAVRFALEDCSTLKKKEKEKRLKLIQSKSH